MTDFRVSIDELTSFCKTSMQSLGANAADAQTVADALVMADSWGTFTHGSKLLFDYVRRIQAGGIRVDTSPEIERSGPAWAIVQANAVMGQVAGKFAMQAAIEKARVCGIGYVGVRNSNHFGAAGYYTWLAANEGFIGISMANDIPSVAGPGSQKAVTGSNPLSYAIPTGEASEPILLDMAISTVAGGKVFAAHQRGEPIPDNWIVDDKGMPSTDSSLYPNSGALQPMANYKGYGIAMLIEALSGVLTGAGMTWQIGSWIFDDPKTPTNHGAAFFAIDINQIMPHDDFYNRMKHIADEIHNAPTVDGIDSILLPGEREWKVHRNARESSIALPKDVVAKLVQLAKAVDLHPDWLKQH